MQVFSGHARQQIFQVEGGGTGWFDNHRAFFGAQAHLGTSTQPDLLRQAERPDLLASALRSRGFIEMFTGSLADAEWFFGEADELYRPTVFTGRPPTVGKAAGRIEHPRAILTAFGIPAEAVSAAMRAASGALKSGRTRMYLGRFSGFTGVLENTFST